MHLSVWFNLNPKDNIVTSNFLCHYFCACWSPDNDLTCLHTLFSYPFKTNPSGCFIYTSSSSSPYKNAVFTSIWWIHLFDESWKDRSYPMLPTIEWWLSLQRVHMYQWSIWRFCLKPCTTNRFLKSSIVQSIFIFLRKIH